MSKTNDYVLRGPKKQDKILFTSFGKYLFQCLQKRNSEDIVAIDAGENEELTCGTLLMRSVKFSHVLKDIPITSEDVVALLCENTIKSYTPSLALLYLGVPIHFVNFSYSLDELRHAFNITQPKLIICSKAALDNVLILKNTLKCIKMVVLLDGSNDNGCQIRSIDDLIGQVDVDVQEFETTVVNPEATACLCMSSGTTGLPKCVELTHSNLEYCTNYVVNQDCFSVSSEDVTVSVLPFFHIYGQIVNFAAITASMKIVLLKRFKPESFFKAIVTYKATKLFAVPSLIYFLFNSHYINDYDMSSVTDILVGGSYLSEELYEKAMTRLNNVTIRQVYGATELTGACIMQKPTSKVYSIGSLVPNTDCKIIDVVTKTPVGPGHPGEICIRGKGNSKGYYNNSEETLNSFDNDNYYHTGDVGYYNSEGLLFIVGRIKELIKYKGFQVPPAELETLIVTHPAVKDCGVIGIHDDAAGQLPMACVVAENNANVTENEIIKFVAEKISYQKRLHGGVKFVDKIPRTELGKIQRAKLAQLVGKQL